MDAWSNLVATIPPTQAGAEIEYLTSITGVPRRRLSAARRVRNRIAHDGSASITYAEAAGALATIHEAFDQIRFPTAPSSEHTTGRDLTQDQRHEDYQQRRRDRRPRDLTVDSSSGGRAAGFSAVGPNGVVVKLRKESGWGYIETEQGDSFLFLMDDVSEFVWDALEEGQRVLFEVGGPGARNVRLA